jgi:hypothetical protein
MLLPADYGSAFCLLESAELLGEETGLVVTELTSVTPFSGSSG